MSAQLKHSSSAPTTSTSRSGLETFDKVVIGGFILFIVWLGYTLAQHAERIDKENREFKSACESRGGVVLQGRDFRWCVNPEMLR